jgi:uncharacterized membrane protein (Fun14 family)
MSKTPRERSKEGSGGGMSGYHKAVLVLICLVLVGSIAARAWTAGDGGGGGGGAPAGASSFMQGSSGGSRAAPDEPEGPVEKSLPAVTEASFFALIGFALGYTTKKLVKLGLLLVALAFVAVQVLVHFGALEVDWNALVEKLNRLVLNVREDGTVQELVTDRIPTAGGLGAGWLLGLRRG